MRKLITVLVVVPLALVFILFAVANRQIVTLVLDPFDSGEPAFALRMPLFLLSFLLLGIGVLIGSFATWLKQHRWRVRARAAERELRALRDRLAEPRWPPEADRAPPASPSAPLIMPPAA